MTGNGSSNAITNENKCANRKQKQNTQLFDTIAMEGSFMSHE
jgi:hypothetical protein